MQRLWRLLEAPVYGEVPSALGIWGEIYYRLHKLAKRWHAQVRQVEQQHVFFMTERLSQILLTLRIASLAQTRGSERAARAVGRVGIE